MTENGVSREIDLLIVDDDADFRDDMARYFSRCGYRVDHCGDGRAALERIQGRSYDVAIVDMVMPDIGGMEMLESLRAAGAECPIVMLTGKGTVENAVEAMKLGAADFISKPARLKELEAVVDRVLEGSRLRQENAQLRVALQQQTNSSPMIGESPPILQLYRLIERIGPTDKAVLIQGESGTGKELVARALHQASPWRDKPLVIVNCAALPETLLESEMFGHEKGAFTGAATSKPGLFEVADGGTLFIDEIGELAPSLQAKLLRVLEDGTLRRVGSVKQRRVRVRLLAATNRDLADEVQKGGFREDLFYRINVLTVQLPPLRQRPGDVRILLDHFVGNGWRIDPDVLPALVQYSWPGNVRQLRNAIERAKVLAEDDVIRIENFPPEISRGPVERTPIASPAELDLEQLNKMFVADTLKRHAGNKARTARALGISRRALYRLLEKYQIEVNSDSAIPN
ncbi:sigma-54 dependent transcriptional regulator [bacterium]|nr:sigma-54 dependent transcriptional regulator [bacterium]